MLKDTLFKELRASLESVNIDEIVPEIYAGSEVAEELLACDDNDNLLAACESQSEAFTAIAFENQEIVLESMGLTLPEFGKVTESLGNEAIVNAVKRGAYNVVIAVKKAIKKIMALIMAVVDFFILADGRWKSYSKLFKKYREKLIKLKPGMSEKATEKEYTLRNSDVVVKLVKALQTALSSDSSMLSNVKKITNGITVEDVANNITRVVTGLYTILGATNPKLRDAVNGKVASIKINSISTEVINKAIDTYQEFENSGELKEAVKEAKTEWNEKLKDTSDVKAQDAVTKLIEVLSELENNTKKDLKYLKDIKKIKKDIDKAIENYKPTRDKDGNETSDHEYDGAILRLFGTISGLINKAKYLISGTIKAANDGMQVVLADAAKVIAGETRVTE